VNSFNRIQSWVSSNISNEGKLLLNCARVHTDIATTERIGQLLDSDLDWSYIERSAVRNDVLPLLYNSLINTFPDAVPTQVMESLDTHVSAIVSKNESNLSILLEIMRLFDVEGIPVIPFKGITFAIFVYGSLSLRNSVDIDLLVHRKDFLKAKDLLIRNGYHHAYFGCAEVYAVQSQLISDDGRTGVDLHYGLTPKYQHPNIQELLSGSKIERRDWNKIDSDCTNWFFYLESEPMWERLITLEIRNTPVAIFSPEDMLLVASINGMKENWRMLKRVCDIADLVRNQPSINWNWIFGQVRTFRCERKFILGLLLAYKLVDMPLPEEPIGRIKTSPFLMSLTYQARNRFCLDQYKSDLEEFRRISSLLTMDNYIDRLNYLRYITRVIKVPDNLIASIINYFNFLRSLFWQLVLLLIYRINKNGLGN